jgi:hypothetical protein
MPHLAKLTIHVVAVLVVGLSTAPSRAASSTAQGHISVVQVLAMLDKASTDRTAEQVLVAYLSGLGEAAGAVVKMGGAACRTPPNLSAANVRQAISEAAGKPDASEIAATPLIVRDMLDRAGCRRS